ncbi:unnamed protein product [Ceutorhynchus assimilis]|uniref:Prokaryotic-type class I peptide chain release factors domain-containing protein n=1 Tax=Ceutorhynchus assimilis TaxID=467358 RepID=A0A9N9MFX1_9CUCU|nr:unnamed protein product [Ceutorhynchus assimilis]
MRFSVRGYPSFKKRIDFTQVPTLNEADLKEQQIKGSGPGGQKIDKTSSCIFLRHILTGMVVKCQETRSVYQNKKIARQLLVTKLDNYFNKGNSVEAQTQLLQKRRSALYEQKKEEAKGQWKNIEGVFDPVDETLSVTNPKTGKTELKQGHRDPATGEVLFKGLVNPKINKIDNCYGRTIRFSLKELQVDPSIIAQSVEPEKLLPVSPVKLPPTAAISPRDKNKVIKLLVITAKRDPKTGHLDLESGHKKATVTITDRATGKRKAVHGQRYPISGQILLPNCPVELET